MDPSWQHSADQSDEQTTQTQPWTNKPLLTTGMPAPEWQDQPPPFRAQMSQQDYDTQQPNYQQQQPLPSSSQHPDPSPHSLPGLELLSDQSEQLSLKRASSSSLAGAYAHSALPLTTNAPLLAPPPISPLAHPDASRPSTSYFHHAPPAPSSSAAAGGGAYYSREYLPTLVEAGDRSSQPSSSSGSNAHRHSMPYPPTQHYDWPAPHSSSLSHPQMRPNLHPLISPQPWAGSIPRPQPQPLPSGYAGAVHSGSVGMSWDGSASEPSSSGLPSPIQVDRPLPGTDGWSASAGAPGGGGAGVGAPFDPWYAGRYEPPQHSREGSGHYHQPIAPGWQVAGPSSGASGTHPPPPLLGRSNSYHYGDSAHYTQQRHAFAPQQAPLYEQQADVESGYAAYTPYGSTAPGFGPAESALPSSETADRLAKRSRATTDPGAAPSFDDQPARKGPKTSAKSKRASISSMAQIDGSAAGPVKRKLAVDLHASCGTCGIALARLILRGKAEELAVPHQAVFTCLDCAPDVEPPAAGGPSASAGGGGSRRKSRSSKATDGAAAGGASGGSSSAGPSGKLQPRLNTSSSSTTFRKRNKKKFDDVSALTACDVCLRDIAIGAVLADDRSVEIEFTVEVVCVRCDSRYMRCSDCGGGGGSRLGAGKWRSVELFENGRKTCRLSHDRLGSLTDMSYDVRSIRDVPRDEMNEVVRQSEAIFKNTLISGMCTPEVLETQSAVAKSYDEIVAMTENGWRGIQQLFRVDIEPMRSIRRYVGVRSCTPNPRKSQKARAQEAERPFPQGGVLLRAGKDVIGFVLAEWDFLIGSLFLCVVVPWSTGESFDATTRMLVELIATTEADREELNRQRRAAGQGPLPELRQIWTMMFFKRETRMMAHLEKKRGFVPLEDYLQQYADARREEFAPIRECYLPRERQTDWHVLVKRQSDNDDDWTSHNQRTNSSAR